MAVQVVGAQRLFDPRRVTSAEHLERRRRTVEVPPLVRVDHERAVGAEHFAHGAHAVEVFGDVGLADLDLDGVEAGIHPAPNLVHELVERVVQVHPAAVGADALALRTQESRQ